MYWIAVELIQFVPNFYKLGLIKTLVKRMRKINNSWAAFDKDLKDLKNILHKNEYRLK